MARDPRHTGTVPALAAGFIEIELDVETGRVEILDYVGVADCGVVLHPQSLATQVRGGAVMGFGMALTERHVYDPRWGLPAAIGLYQAKPPTYLDTPGETAWSAVEIADPENPVGAKGIGECATVGGPAAFVNAVMDALKGYGVRNVDMPLLPDRVYEAIQTGGDVSGHPPVKNR